MANSLKKIIPLFMGLCLALTVSAGTVNLNFFVGSTLIHTESVTEGSSQRLSTIISAAEIDMSSYACRSYSFYGWKEGSRVSGSETPVVVNDVTPTDNMNYYAVFENDPSKVNRFVRVTTLDNLEANAEYLIVCYYVYGGDQQYYALGNQNGEYVYNNSAYSKIDAERLYPRNGIISEPPADLVWTLKPGASAGTWKWYNAEAATDSKELYIGDNSSYYMARPEGYGSSCTITVANGIFTIQSGSYILKYVDDEITETEDYFITGSTSTVSNYPIYLYKKESPYVSYPDCNAWTVYVDAIDGSIPGKTAPADISRDTLTETSVTPGGVTLPTPNKPDPSCTDWTFAGWHIDSPIEGTTEAPVLHPAGDYKPLYNGVTLFAVFQTTTTEVYYEKITDRSQLKATDTCVIVYPLNEYAGYAVTYSNSTTSWTRSAVLINGSELATSVKDEMKWNYKSSSNYFYWRTDNSTSWLAYSGSVFNPSSGASPFTLSYVSSGWWSTTTYYLYLNGSNFTRSSSYYNSFDIYVRKTRSVPLYNTYPHCTQYSVIFNACGGTVIGDEVITEDAGGGLWLPSATASCDGWEFYGWLEGDELPSYSDVTYTDQKSPGTRYYPKYDNTTLYAVYKRATDRFRIVEYAAATLAEAVNDTYLITYYADDPDEGGDNMYDFELSAEKYSNSYLDAKKGESPQDGTDYFIDEADSTYMWVLGGSADAWTFESLKYPGMYFSMTTGRDTTGLSTTAATFKIERPNATYRNLYIYVGNKSRYLSCDGAKYSATTSGDDQCFLYRRIKEYASWPHCEVFEVAFEAGSGTADDGSITESEPYAGITLPNAYSNADCSKEGWTFVGWCERPITEETSLLTFDLYPAGTLYHPVSSKDTLYAVYQVKTNHYKRITTVARLHTGVNYIITTDGNKALANMPNNPTTPTSITSVSVSPDAAWIITNTNPAIEWRFEGAAGVYELYNPARDVYLDLRTSGTAVMNKTGEIEKQDNFFITYDASLDQYYFRSNMSIVNNAGKKYLNYYNSYFNADTKTNASKLYIYRQQANYYSYPVCSEDVDVVKWAKVDETFNSVTVESYHLKGEPIIHGSYGSPELQEDGTYVVTFRSAKLLPCSQATVEWDGVTSRIRIPYIVSADANLNASTLLNGTATDCSECDVYVEPGNTLTVTATDTIRKIYVPDNATLNVADDQTLSVSILSLFSEGDQAAPQVNLNSRGSIILRNNGELYYDKRIDDSRYYWFSLPFNSQLKEISFVNEAANDGLPQHYSGTDGDNVDRAFFVKTYNGALRAADANGGALATTYWTDVTTRGSDYTLRAGLGYEIGLADQADKYFNGQNYKHTSRTFRFTMRPGNTWLAEERTGGGSKSATVVPSTVADERNAVHAGWNLIGNPYMHTYNTGTVPDNGNIKNGAWIKEKDIYGDYTGWWILDETDPTNRPTDVPYLTIYHPEYEKGDRYRQVLASDHDLRPFEAVFVQVNVGNTLNFGNNMSVSAMPAYRRAPELDEPVRTGIMISGNNRMDRTGFVLSEDYTPAYEIGADLEKVINSYTKKGQTIYNLNLYSLDSLNHQLAFNGLSLEAALDTIPLGLTIPAAGEYTFSYDADWYGVKAKYFEAVELIDKQLNTSTNLLNSIYSFTAEAEQNDNRFALVIRLKEQSDYTDVDEIYDADGPRKVIRDNHLFIINDDKIYNATGARVR